MHFGLIGAKARVCRDVHKLVPSTEQLEAVIGGTVARYPASWYDAGFVYGTQQ